MFEAGALRTFFGSSGQDGLPVDAGKRVVVAHASLGCAFAMNARGEVAHVLACRRDAGGGNWHPGDAGPMLLFRPGKRARRHALPPA